MSDKFRAWNDGDDESDGRDIDAFDLESAACVFVELDESDRAEYPTLDGKTATVNVRNEFGEVTRWKVYGEAVPQYYAYQADEKEAGNG
jgi:hypothetical protein